MWVLSSSLLLSRGRGSAVLARVLARVPGLDAPSVTCPSSKVPPDSSQGQARPFPKLQVLAFLCHEGKVRRGHEVVREGPQSGVPNGEKRTRPRTTVLEHCAAEIGLHANEMLPPLRVPQVPTGASDLRRFTQGGYRTLPRIAPALAGNLSQTSWPRWDEHSPLLLRDPRDPRDPAGARIQSTKLCVKRQNQQHPKYWRGSHRGARLQLAGPRP